MMTIYIERHTLLEIAPCWSHYMGRFNYTSIYNSKVKETPCKWQKNCIVVVKLIDNIMHSTNPTLYTYIDYPSLVLIKVARQSDLTLAQFRSCNLSNHHITAHHVFCWLSWFYKIYKISQQIEDNSHIHDWRFMFGLKTKIFETWLLYKIPLHLTMNR